MMFLAGAQISISHAVTLAPDDILDWNGIQSMADCQYMASNVEVVPKVNNLQYYSCIFSPHYSLYNFFQLRTQSIADYDLSK